MDATTVILISQANSCQNGYAVSDGKPGKSCTSEIMLLSSPAVPFVVPEQLAEGEGPMESGEGASCFAFRL